MWVMKPYILLLVCLFLICTASAQWSNEWLNSSKNKHLLYTNSDLMVGAHSGGNLGMSFVYNTKYSIEVGYSATSNQFNSRSGLKSAGKSNSDDISTPTLMMENFNVMAGRHFKINPEGTIRFVLQGGPGMSVMMETKDLAEGNNSNNFVRSEMVKTKDFSVMLNSKFEFTITDLFGFSAGPTLIANQDKRFLTFSVGFMYGIISKNQDRY